MENNNTPWLDVNVSQPIAGKTFFASVFTWMFIALAITTVVAFITYNNPAWQASLFSSTTGKMNGLGKAVMFAPLIFAFAIGLGYTRMSFPVLLGCFVSYAAINGVTFSFILAAYTGNSIAMCFGGAALVFGIMAVMGYTTNQDLSKMGKILFAGLLAVIIMSIVNYFMRSSGLDYLLSIGTIIIFTGLTAYDVQKIKNIGMGIDAKGNAIAVTDTKKLAIMGAFSLYLDFINIFLAMLRLFGSKK